MVIQIAFVFCYLVKNLMLETLGKLTKVKRVQKAVIRTYFDLDLDSIESSISANFRNVLLGSCKTVSIYAHRDLANKFYIVARIILVTSPQLTSGIHEVSTHININKPL